MTDEIDYKAYYMRNKDFLNYQDWLYSIDEMKLKIKGLEAEVDVFENDNKRLREEVELWKRSYHASERRLIERGKTIDELISQNSESQKCENNKKLKDMTPSEIIKGVKSGIIKSESYNSVEEYIEDMHKEDKK